MRFQAHTRMLLAAAAVAAAVAAAAADSYAPQCSDIALADIQPPTQSFPSNFVPSQHTDGMFWTTVKLTGEIEVLFNYSQWRLIHTLTPGELDDWTQQVITSENTLGPPFMMIHYNDIDMEGYSNVRYPMDMQVTRENGNTIIMAAFVMFEEFQLHTFAGEVVLREGFFRRPGTNRTLDYTVLATYKWPALYDTSLPYQGVTLSALCSGNQATASPALYPMCKVTSGEMTISDMPVVEPDDTSSVVGLSIFVDEATNEVVVSASISSSGVTSINLQNVAVQHNGQMYTIGSQVSIDVDKKELVVGAPISFDAQPVYDTYEAQDSYHLSMNTDMARPMSHFGNATDNWYLGTVVDDRYGDVYALNATQLADMLAAYAVQRSLGNEFIIVDWPGSNATCGINCWETFLRTAAVEEIYNEAERQIAPHYIQFTIIQVPPGTANELLSSVALNQYTQHYPYHRTFRVKHPSRGQTTVAMGKAILCTACSQRNTRCPWCDMTFHVLERNTSYPYRVARTPDTTAALAIDNRLTVSLSGEVEDVFYQAEESTEFEWSVSSKMRVKTIGLASKSAASMVSLTQKAVLMPPDNSLWLSVPKTKIGTGCNQLGISDTTFVQQGVNRCDVPLGTCLGEQIYNLKQSLTNRKPFNDDHLWGFVDSAKSTPRARLNANEDALQLQYQGNDSWQLQVRLPFSSLRFNEPYILGTRGEWEDNGNPNGCNVAKVTPSATVFQEQKGKLSFSLYNYGTADGDVVVEIDCESLEVDGVTAKTVTVPPGKRRYVHFDLVAPRSVAVGNINHTCHYDTYVTRLPLWSTVGKYAPSQCNITIPTYSGLFTPPCLLDRSAAVTAQDLPISDPTVMALELPNMLSAARLTVANQGYDSRVITTVTCLGDVTAFIASNEKILRRGNSITSDVVFQKASNALTSNGSCTVTVATNAYGMVCDQPDKLVFRKTYNFSS